MRFSRHASRALITPPSAKSFTQSTQTTLFAKANAMNAEFWKRLWAYALQRLAEPSTWAALIGLGTYWTGKVVPPEQQTMITDLGITVVLGLIAASRDGRNKPDNPSLGTVIKGVMPPPKPAIVPPSTEGMAPLTTTQRSDAVVDAAGEVHAPPPVKPNG